MPPLTVASVSPETTVTAVVPPLAEAAEPPAVPSAVLETFTLLVAVMDAGPPVATIAPPDTATFAVLPTVVLETAASLLVAPGAAGAVSSAVVTLDVAVKLTEPLAVMLPLSNCRVAPSLKRRCPPGSAH